MLNGLDDLPADIAVVIQENAAQAAPDAKAAVELDSVDSLVRRLLDVRERLFMLQAVWATTLSQDVYQEAEHFRRVFQELSAQLRVQDQAALDRIVTGHEALLLSEPIQVKGTIPVEVQQRCEMLWELQARPRLRPALKPSGYITDGMQNFL